MIMTKEVIKNFATTADGEQTSSQNLLSGFGGKPKKKITVIETCAGYGTTRLALMEMAKQLGLDVEFDFVAISEIDKTAIAAYEKLHGETLNLGDITKVDFSKWPCDILSFTFPCQSISQANNKKTGTGFEENANSKSSIVWSLKKILSDMPRKPRLILFENVKAILNKKNKPTLDKLVAFLESEGYSVAYKNLDSQIYSGIPQHRERVFILATLGEEVGFEWPKPVPLKFELKDILEKNPDEKFYITDVARAGFLKRALEKNYGIRVHNPSKAKVAFTISTKSGGRNYDNFIWENNISDDNLIRVSASNLDKLPVSLDVIQNTRFRKLTPEEVMTLTGLTKEHQEKLKDFSPTQIYKLMGNGIVVPTLTAIFCEYFKKLQEDGKLEAF